MRSSKSRSRNKSRNQRSLGNVVNRVFDSSGPEGKVRGTPQQIIEKYLALARDAQLSGDRVAEQSFLQHAEHYTRMLGEAMREQAERQAQFGGPQQNGEDRDERPAGQDRRDEQRRDEQRRDADSEGPRRDERRDERRDDRQDDTRDRQRRDDTQREGSQRWDRRDGERREDRRAPSPRHPSLEAARDVGAHDALPDFLRPAAPGIPVPQGIPEALATGSEAGPVDMPERRTAADTEALPLRDAPDDAPGVIPVPAAPGEDAPAGRAAAENGLSADSGDTLAGDGREDERPPVPGAPAAEAEAEARRPRRRAASPAPRRVPRKRSDAAAEEPPTASDE